MKYLTYIGLALLIVLGGVIIISDSSKTVLDTPISQGFMKHKISHQSRFYENGKMPQVETNKKRLFSVLQNNRKVHHDMKNKSYHSSLLSMNVQSTKSVANVTKHSLNTGNSWRQSYSSIAPINNDFSNTTVTNHSKIASQTFSEMSMQRSAPPSGGNLNPQDNPDLLDLPLNDEMFSFIGLLSFFFLYKRSKKKQIC